MTTVISSAQQSIAFSNQKRFGAVRKKKSQIIQGELHDGGKKWHLKKCEDDGNAAIGDEACLCFWTRRVSKFNMYACFVLFRSHSGRKRCDWSCSLTDHSQSAAFTSCVFMREPVSRFQSQCDIAGFVLLIHVWDLHERRVKCQTQLNHNPSSPLSLRSTHCCGVPLLTVSTRWLAFQFDVPVQTRWRCRGDVRIHLSLPAAFLSSVPRCDKKQSVLC